VRKPTLELSFKLDERLAQAAQKQLAAIPGAMAKAAERAINRTLTRAKTRWVKAVTAEYRIKQKTVVDSLRLDNASAKKQKLHGKVEVTWDRKRRRTPPRLELVEFVLGAKPWSSYARVPKIGAMVQVKRRGFRGRIPHVFVERGRQTGKLHAMWRGRSGGRLEPRDARILYGPSVFDMARRTRPGIEGELARYLQRRFGHEVRFIIGQSGLGGR